MYIEKKRTGIDTTGIEIHLFGAEPEVLYDLLCGNGHTDRHNAMRERLQDKLADYALHRKAATS